MLVAILYFLSFLYLFIAYRSKAKNSVGTILIAFYLISSFLTLLESNQGSSNSDHLGAMATVYYTVTVLISMWPFLILGKNNCTDFELPKHLILYLTYFLILFGLVDVIYSIIDISSNIDIFINNIADVRSNYYDNSLDTSIDNSAFDALIIFARSLQFMSPFCCIYYIINNRKALAVMLLIASLSVPLHGMVNGARGGILVFLANFLFCLIFFRPYLTNVIYRKIKKIGYALISPFILYFVAMTIARFGTNEGGSLSSIYSYGGDMPYFFTHIFNDPLIDSQKLKGRYCFQWLFPSNERAWQQLNTYIDSDIYLNQFGGLPGSFFLDFGYYAVLMVGLFAVLYYLIIKATRRRYGKYPFYILFLFYFSYQVLFMNLFYYQFTYAATIMFPILFFVLAYIYSKFVRRSCTLST